MGVYLNPGKQDFQMALNSEIFVDKTRMIRYLNSLINTNQRFVSVSRPRRFGKTMAADMLCAYYDRTADSRDMFEKTLLSDSGFEETLSPGSDESNKTSLPWDYYLGKYDVIRLVMTDFIRMDCSVTKSLQRMQKRILEELSEIYPSVRYDPEDFLYSMSRFYAGTGTQFVIVIDEWDAIFRTRKQDKDGQTEYLNFLRDWLKGKNYVALAYMTGILPIKKYGQHSALNMFDEYSMISPMRLAPYAGFTDEEVRNLCEKFQMSYTQISDWYDGYRLSDTIPVEKRELYRTGEYTEHNYAIYSPLSVVNAMRSGMIRNYWNNTETYEALAEYIRMDFDGLKNMVALLMDGGRAKPNISGYQNDMTSFRVLMIS